MKNNSMKVFQGLHNVAGAPSVIAQGLRSIGVDAESICYQSGHAAYQVDVELKNESDRQRKQQGQSLLKRALKEFDVFHFHYGETILGTNLADIPILKKAKKKIFFHFHGCDIRDSKLMFEVDNSPCRPCWPMGCSANRNTALEVATNQADGVFVSTPDLLRYFENATLILQPLDPAHMKKLTDSATFMKAPSKGEAFKIAHAPSNRTMKGTHHIINAVKTLQHEGKNITLDLIEGVKNTEVIERFRDSHMVIDQMYTGCYGTVSVEAMAIGRPVLSNIQSQYAKSYPKDLPIVPICKDTIYGVLNAILDAPEHIDNLGYVSRNYVIKHHDAGRTTRRLVELYESS